MSKEINELDSFLHYGYQAANYAMEPIRLYVWGALRSFVAPSFDQISQKTQEIYNKVDGPEIQRGSLEEFKGKISQTDFTSSSPYFSTKAKEVAFRVLLGAAVLAVPLVGANILYLPYFTRGIQFAFSCGVMGQVLHASLASLSKRTYTVIRSEEASKEEATCTSIASWNIGLVSIFAPLNVGTWESVVSFHWAKHLLRRLGIDVAPSRIESQAEIVRKLNTDIVCFQEFYDPLQAKALYREARDTYPYAYLDIGAHSWKGPSGLGVFSKLPLQNFQVHDFKTKSQGLDRGTNKKFVTFDVQIQGKFTRVYMAHLNCGNHPEARRAQLEEINTHMDSLLEEEIERCMILGDLNFDRTTPNAVDTRYFNEHFEDHIPSVYTCSDALKFKHSLSREIDFESIDYIASKRGGDLLFAKDSTVILNSETLNVSDHNPVTAEF